MQQPLVPRPRGAPASVQFKEGNVGKSAVTGEQLAGTVGRSVVYSNKLYTVSARLREHAVHALGDIALRIICGNYDRDIDCGIRRRKRRKYIGRRIGTREEAFRLRPCTSRIADAYPPLG